nr:hypothetical protein [uncultured Cohaesibacter sp.]
MLHNQTVFFCWLAVGLLIGGLLEPVQAKALHKSCPQAIAKFNPKSGDVFLTGRSAEVIKVRSINDEPIKSFDTEASIGMQLYYFVSSTEPSTPMLFALLRAIEIDGRTSLQEDRIAVSNSDYVEKEFQIRRYNRYHDERYPGFNSLRIRFHMTFRPGSTSHRDSYSGVESPTIYRMGKEYVLDPSHTFKGYKARMQRVRGIGADGRCVRFSMFENRSFARAVRYQETTILVLGEKSDQALDQVQINLYFK